MWCWALALAVCMALVRQLPAQAPSSSPTSSSMHQAHLIRFHNYTDKQILDYLLDPVRYDHRIRPEEKTLVNVSVLLLTLSSPDESSLKYEIEFLLHQKWEDRRLRFLDDVATPMGHLNGLLHESRVWKPDIYFLKHGEFKSPLTPIHMSLRLYPNGTVIYTLSLRRQVGVLKSPKFLALPSPDGRAKKSGRPGRAKNSIPAIA